MKLSRALTAGITLIIMSLTTNQATAQDNCLCVNRMASLTIDNEKGTLSNDEMDEILLDECPSLHQPFRHRFAVPFFDQTEGMQRLIAYPQSCPKEANQSLKRLEASGLLQFSSQDADNVCFALNDLDRIINEMMSGMLSESDAESQLSEHMSVFSKMESAEDIDGIYLMYSCPTVWQKFMKYADLLR